MGLYEVHEMEKHVLEATRDSNDLAVRKLQMELRT